MAERLACAPSRMRRRQVFLSLIGLVALVVAWSLAIRFGGRTILPGPWRVLRGLMDLMAGGVLFHHVVASLFRVTWGYGLAVLIGIPLGLMLGWYRRGELALNPFFQILRPISPLAWIPISILWFGVGDLGAVFLIFLGLVAAADGDRDERGRAASRTCTSNAGRNFGLSSRELLTQVRLPGGDRRS